VLRAAVRDRGTGTRRAFVRYFACEQDLSHEPANTMLPEPVAQGHEPFLVVGAMAGG
jgi:sulfur-carrier protein